MKSDVLFADMNSDDIRDEIVNSMSDITSSESELSFFRNISDPDDPSVHHSDLDYGSDSEGEQTNLSDRSMDVDDPMPTGSNLIQQRQDESEDEIIVTKDDEVIIWHAVEGNLNTFNFRPNENPGLSQYARQKLVSNTPFEFYSLFLDDEILDLIISETNRYAEQRIISGILKESVPRYLQSWYDTTKDEILTFLGIVLWMGLDQKPKLRNYWSTNPMYKCELSKAMSRNRFEAILSCLHVANNETAVLTDRLAKLKPLIDALTNKFQNTVHPDEDVCIDESMIPFRGRVNIRQYIPSKRHRYGIKLFKLCLKGGYTWNMKVYAGKQPRPQSQSISTMTVMELMRPLLGKGYTLYTDNFYTSVQLAQQLNDKETHLIGTLRRNRKMNSKKVEKRILRKGQMINKQNNTSIIIGKWKDKRDVMYLTTKLVPTLVETQTRTAIVRKPSTILDYNSAKSYIDVSDQLASYGSTVRRGVKWYRKVIFELLTNTALVNAHAVYKSTVLSPKDIVAFREDLVKYLLIDRQVHVQEPDTRMKHTLSDVTPRGRCTPCYQFLATTTGRNEASKKCRQVKTKCNGCPEFKYMCLDCFLKKHRCELKSKKNPL